MKLYALSACEIAGRPDKSRRFCFELDLTSVSSQARSRQTVQSFCLKLRVGVVGIEPQTSRSGLQGATLEDSNQPTLYQWLTAYTVL